MNGQLLHTEKLSLTDSALARQSHSRVVEEFDGLRSLTAPTDARAEEWEHFAPRPIGERVEQTHVVGVVEGHSSLLAV